MRSRLVAGLRTILLLGALLPLVTGCVTTRPENPEWWDAEGNRKPSAGESLATTGTCVGTVALIGAGLAAVGLAWLVIETYDGDR